MARGSKGPKRKRKSGTGIKRKPRLHQDVSDDPRYGFLESPFFCGRWLQFIAVTVPEEGTPEIYLQVCDLAGIVLSGQLDETTGADGEEVDTAALTAKNNRNRNIKTNRPDLWAHFQPHLRKMKFSGPSTRQESWGLRATALDEFVDQYGDVREESYRLRLKNVIHKEVAALLTRLFLAGLSPTDEGAAVTNVDEEEKSEQAESDSEPSPERKKRKQSPLPSPSSSRKHTKSLSTVDTALKSETTTPPQPILPAAGVPPLHMLHMVGQWMSGMSPR